MDGNAKVTVEKENSDLEVGGTTADVPESSQAASDLVAIDVRYPIWERSSQWHRSSSIAGCFDERPA